MPQTIEIKTSAGAPASTGTLVIYVAEGAAPAGGAAAIWAATGLDWSRVTRAAGFKGKQGQMLDLLAPDGLEAARLLVLGAGKPDAAASPSAWTDRGGSLAGKLMGLKADQVAVLLDEPAATPDRVAELAAGLRLRHYRFDKYRAKKDEPGDAAVLAITLHVADPAAADAAIANRGATVAGHAARPRPDQRACQCARHARIRRAAQQLTALGVAVEQLDEPAMRALGMNALLAVSQGSARPPRLVIMSWNGGKKGDAPLAFVGKGVVFDTGGISIKGAAGMEDMKGDMGGAAAVTGLMHALATRKAAVNAIGVIGLVENMPSSTAMRPGDIVKAMSRHHHRDHQHRRRGPPRARRRALVHAGPLQAALHDQPRDPHRRHRRRARQRSCGPVLQQRRALRQPPRRRSGDGREALAHAHGPRLRQADREPLRRHQEQRRPPGRLDHRRPVPAALRQRRALGPPRYRRHRARLPAPPKPTRPGAPASALPCSTASFATITRRHRPRQNDRDPVLPPRKPSARTGAPRARRKKPRARLEGGGGNRVRRACRGARPAALDLSRRQLPAARAGLGATRTRCSRF